MAKRPLFFKQKIFFENKKHLICVSLYYWNVELHDLTGAGTSFFSSPQIWCIYWPVSHVCQYKQLYSVLNTAMLCSFISPSQGKLLLEWHCKVCAFLRFLWWVHVLFFLLDFEFFCVFIWLLLCWRLIKLDAHVMCINCAVLFRFTSGLFNGLNLALWGYLFVSVIVIDEIFRGNNITS